MLDVKTLCLGLLSRGEASGYDLKKDFESLFRHFFPAGYGSIYPALAGLADEGLVSCTTVPQSGRPERKVYRVTPRGREAFVAAISQLTPQHKLRSEFLAVMYFADLMDEERLNAILDGQLAQLHATVEHIRAIEAEHGADAAPGARFVAGFGAAMATAAAEYIEANRRLLTRERKARQRSGSRAAAGRGRRIEERA